MGTVWLAEHTMIGRRAALKLLRPMFTAQPEVVKRFFNEARAATAVADPGIVQIFDFGYHTDGSAYIAMEMLDGEALDHRLQRLGRLPVNDALRILRQVASTLGATHARGIVHRDLKPENIFLVPDAEVPGGERAKVLDFGIAKLTGDAHLKTNTSAILGTPAFMSPEQCRGAGHVDQRADVYGMGCLLFVLLTGRTPFEADGPGDLIAMHLREPPPRPSACAPGIPLEVDDLVLRCLKKDPGKRFASGTELAAELGRLVSTPLARPLDGQSPPEPSRVPPSAATTLSLSRASFFRTTSTSIRRAGIAGAVVLVGSGALVLNMSVRRSDQKPGEPNSAQLPPTNHLAEDLTVNATATPDEELQLEPEPEVALAGQMKTVLARFADWARTHSGMPCPSISSFGDGVVDPWGTPLLLTCTDQPANQVAGVISAGTDRTMGTPDDRGSWQMPHDVTELVHGPRWNTGTSPLGSKAVKPVKKKPVHVEEDTDDIPSER